MPDALAESAADHATTGHITLGRRGAAAIITIDRAERLNAVTFAMIAEIRRMVDQAVADSTVTGVIITGSGRAYRIGLVDRLVDADRLLVESCAYLDDMAATVAPRSIAIMKQQVYDGLSQTITAALDDADAHMRASLTHPDLAEGVASFVERRPPRFQPLDRPHASAVRRLAHTHHIEDR